MWRLAVMAVLGAMCTEGARISGAVGVLTWPIRFAMWGLVQLAEGIAGDMCPKADIPVSFHLRLHDPEVMDVASAQQGFAHHHHLDSPERSGVEAGVVATGIVPRAVRHLASRAAGVSESSQAGMHSDSGFIAVNMTLSSHIRIWGEDEDVEAPLAVVLLSSQPPVRAPSEPEAAADTKTEPQRTRGAMDLAAEAHAPLAMVKVWLGEEELMSESIEKACRSNYSTLHLGQAPPESDDRAHTHHGDQEVLSEVPAVPDMCNLTILVPCELLRRQLRRAQQDMWEDARLELGAMVWSVATPWTKSVVELPLWPSLCAPRGGAMEEGKVHNSEERIKELEAPVSRLDNDVKKNYEQKVLHGEHHPPAALPAETATGRAAVAAPCAAGADALREMGAFLSNVFESAGVHGHALSAAAAQRACGEGVTLAELQDMSLAELRGIFASEHEEQARKKQRVFSLI